MCGVSFTTELIPRGQKHELLDDTGEQLPCLKRAKGLGKFLFEISQQIGCSAESAFRPVKIFETLSNHPAEPMRLALH
ncbi:hypothetical protein WK69_26465 [Burkholderia ubonensis]|nr:hypothetical protein WK69_26465 [Burkholderia ubonensis]